MNKTIFSVDYVTHHINNWKIILEYLNKTFGNSLHCLEVGAYEGRSALYILDNFVGTAKLTVIDQFNNNIIKRRYLHNISTHPKSNQVDTIIGLSFIELSKLYEQQMQFDFIYIDAGKSAGDNLGNLMLAERILKVGGIMIVDDYQWDSLPDPKHCPKLGIDSFIKVTLLSEVFMEGYQIVFKKIKGNDELLKYNR